jgi:hypothetical protein
MQPGVMLTTAQVAACLSITPRQVGHLAKQHGVGTKVGRDWIFTDQEVRRLADRRGVSVGDMMHIDQSTDGGD